MTDDIYRRYIRHVNDKIAVFIVRYSYSLLIFLDTDTIRLFPLNRLCTISQQETIIVSYILSLIYMVPM